MLCVIHLFAKFHPDPFGRSGVVKYQTYISSIQTSSFIIFLRLGIDGTFNESINKENSYSTYHRFSDSHYLYIFLFSICKFPSSGSSLSLRVVAWMPSNAPQTDASLMPTDAFISTCRSVISLTVFTSPCQVLPPDILTG